MSTSTLPESTSFLPTRAHWNLADEAIEGEIKRFSQERARPLLASKVLLQITMDLLPEESLDKLRVGLIEILELNLKAGDVVLCDKLDPREIQIVPAPAGPGRHCSISWVWNLPIEADKVRLFHEFLKKEVERTQASGRNLSGMAKYLDKVLT